MKIRDQTSQRRETRAAVRRRPTRAALCSCTEARVQRNRSAGEPDPAGQLSEFKIPEPLRMDQNELCAALEHAAWAGGRTGVAARRLLKILQPHLLQEETDLLQLLGLLTPLSRGQITPAMRQVPARTEHLKARMFEIVREHVQIIEAARALLRVARAERKLALVKFTEHLLLRAWTDEVVFYPTAILIGEYLKLRFSGSAAA